MTTIPEYPITTTAAAAKILGVTSATVIVMLKDGRLKGYQTGTRGRWMVYKRSIDALMGVNREVHRSYISSAL